MSPATNEPTESGDPERDIDRSLRHPLSLRTGIAEDASVVEDVHWAGLEAAYRGQLTGWPEVDRDRVARVARWRQWLSSPEIVSIVGEVEGRVIGFCTIRASEDLDADGAAFAEMPTLYVRPDVWHRGYGQLLCGEALRQASRRGFIGVTLWVIDMNTRARQFYAQSGFVADGARKIVEDSNSPVVAHRLRISLQDL